MLKAFSDELEKMAAAQMKAVKSLVKAPSSGSMVNFAGSTIKDRNPFVAVSPRTSFKSLGVQSSAVTNAALQGFKPLPGLPKPKNAPKVFKGAVPTTGSTSNIGNLQKGISNVPSA